MGRRLSRNPALGSFGRWLSGSDLNLLVGGLKVQGGPYPVEMWPIYMYIYLCRGMTLIIIRLTIHRKFETFKVLIMRHTSAAVGSWRRSGNVHPPRAGAILACLACAHLTELTKAAACIQLPGGPEQPRAGPPPGDLALNHAAQQALLQGFDVDRHDYDLSFFVGRRVGEFGCLVGPRVSAT